MKAVVEKERTSPLPFISSEEFYTYPPKLRKLALKIYEADEYKGITEYCKDYNIPYSSTKTMISRYRKKGHDFLDLIGEIHKEKLKKFRREVYQALKNGAINGSIKHIELYLKLIGDLKESEQSGKVTNNLNILMLPALPARPPEEQTVIELENEEIKPTVMPIG